MCYPYSENKDADQLRGYREADLRLCFRICKKPVFLRRGSFYFKDLGNQTAQKSSLIRVCAVCPDLSEKELSSKLQFAVSWASLIFQKRFQDAVSSYHRPCIASTL